MEAPDAVVFITQSVCANCRFWLGQRQHLGMGMLHVDRRNKGNCTAFKGSTPTLPLDRCGGWAVSEALR